MSRGFGHVSFPGFFFVPKNRRPQFDMARRRSKDELARAKEAQWILVGQNGYAGYRICKGCGEMRNCRGRTYEGQRCKDCFKPR